MRARSDLFRVGAAEQWGGQPWRLPERRCAHKTGTRLPNKGTRVGRRDEQNQLVPYYACGAIEAGDADTATDPFHRQDRISTQSAFASSADRQFRNCAAETV